MVRSSIPSISESRRDGVAETRAHPHPLRCNVCPPGRVQAEVDGQACAAPVHAVLGGARRRAVRDCPGSYRYLVRAGDPAVAEIARPNRPAHASLPAMGDERERRMTAPFKARRGFFWHHVILSRQLNHTKSKKLIHSHQRFHTGAH